MVLTFAAHQTNGVQAQLFLLDQNCESTMPKASFILGGGDVWAKRKVLGEVKDKLKRARKRRSPKKGLQERHPAATMLNRYITWCDKSVSDRLKYGRSALLKLVNPEGLAQQSTLEAFCHLILALAGLYLAFS